MALYQFKDGAVDPTDLKRMCYKFESLKKNKKVQRDFFFNINFTITYFTKRFKGILKFFNLINK